MTAPIQVPPERTEPTEPVERTDPPTGRHRLETAPVRLLAAIAVPVAAFVLLWGSFEVVTNQALPKLVVAGTAILVGALGVFALYKLMDFVVDLMPLEWQGRIRPFVFVGPALTVLGVFLVYPAVRTLWLSFYDSGGDTFVGLENYVFAFTDDVMLESFRNNLLWLVIGTVFTVGLGLAIAAMVDRLTRGESVAKSIIFLPMAISFVGASVIWRFVYAFRPGQGEQVGLLNAIWTSFGNAPVPWLNQEPWNNLLLIVILIWLQTGFSMVILSAAIKGVPDELLEAARIDGASELQIFWRVIIPSIRSTILVVTTTMLILILKVFDIVWVMTSGEFGTEVIASRMIKELFRFRNQGRGAAIAVVLMLAVIPVLILNIRRFREEERLR